MSSDWPRRVLLGAVTALVVARPLVWGEDPGQSAGFGDVAGLVLTLLWFWVAAAGALWNYWTSGGRRPGWPELGFLVVLASLATSGVLSTSYKHPAWLVLGEWTSYLLAFLLVRRWADRQLDRRRLTAALLASAVSIAAYALFQYLVELPHLRQQVTGDPRKLAEYLPTQGISVVRDGPFVREWLERLRSRDAFGTFFRPDALAAFLLLCLPAAAAWAWSAGNARRWPKWLAWEAVLVLAVALWFTHSVGGILSALVILLGGGAVWVGRALVRRPRSGSDHVDLPPLGRLAVALVFLLLLVAGVTGGKEGVARVREWWTLRLGEWSASARMLADPAFPRHRWLGVGPGNFSRFYPRYAPAEGPDEIPDPPDFGLELWAAGGPLALAGLLSVLIWFFRRALWRTGGSDHPDVCGGEYLPIAWEYYLGGTVGLLLGFVLWAWDKSGEEILRGGLVAGFRSLLWFGVFALLDGIGPPRETLRKALAAGVGLLLFHLLLSGGIGWPSLAIPLWVAAALAVADQEPRTLAILTRWPVGWLGPVLVLVLAVAYTGRVFLPAFRAAGGWLNEGKEVYAAWPRWQHEIDHAKTVQEKADAKIRVARFVQRDILEPLRRIVRIDPGNSFPLSELAAWHGELWALTGAREHQEQMARRAEEASRLDPEWIAPYLTRHRWDRRFADAEPFDRKQWNQAAAEAMEAVVACAPRQARYRFALAEVYFHLSKSAEGRDQARIAEELDQATADPTRKLTASQRRQIHRWLGTPSGG